jgi:hypothetical protein
MKVLFETQNFQIFILTIGGKYIPKLKLYSLRSSTKARKQQNKNINGYIVYIYFGK